MKRTLRSKLTLTLLGPNLSVVAVAGDVWGRVASCHAWQHSRLLGGCKTVRRLSRSGQVAPDAEH